LTQDQLRQFREEGYVVLRGVMEPDRLDTFREQMERLVETVNANPKKEYNPGFVYSDDKSRKEAWRSNALLHPDLFQPVVTDFLDSPGLLSAVRDVIQDDLRIGGLKALWSPKSLEYDLDWHRDGPNDSYVPDGSQDYLQFNAALYHDASFRMVPGSHARPLTEAEEAECRHGTGPLPGEIVAELDPGDVLFMHSRALHRGKASPDSRRRSLHYTLSAASKPVKQEVIDQHREWYDTLDLGSKISPQVQALFDNLFQWDGKELTERELELAAY